MVEFSSKEKKRLLFKDVVKPALRQAGYLPIGQTYYTMRGDCCLAIRIKSSYYNSASLGYSFHFEIAGFWGKVSDEILRSGPWWERITESYLLPDFGFLHPYRPTAEYCIDGPINGEPQNIELEDLEAQIKNDLHQYILPQLAEIDCFETWARKYKEWIGLYYSERISLLRYFYEAQGLCMEEINLHHFFSREYGLSAQVIRENHELYQQVRAHTYCPKEDHWAFILIALDKEAAERKKEE